MDVKSPCINVCKIDKQSGLCYGCARSLEEIGSWVSMSEQDRQAVMEDVDHRMLIHFGTSRSKRPA